MALILGLLPGTALAVEQEPPSEEVIAVEAPAEEDPSLPEEFPEEAFHVDQFIPMEEHFLSEGTNTQSSGSASISGTVSLPSGSAQSASYLYVELCTPAVLDADGQVLADPVSVRGTRVSFAQGQSSGNYTISGVEPGEYILQVYSYVSSGSTLGGELYFNADGSVVGNPYAAEALYVSAGTTVNLTLPAASRTISGTLEFDSAPAKDTTFQIYCYENSNYTNYSSTVTLQAGSKSASFSIGVEPGQYPLQINNTETNNYAYYDIYGNASKNYQEEMILNTLDESVTGLKINCTSLLDPSASGSEAGEVEVTVQLPAPLTEEREYEVYLADEKGYFKDSSIVYAYAGDVSFTLQFTEKEGESFRVAYCDVTNCTNYYSLPTGARYASENGITTQLSEAKVFTGGKDTSITIAEPACYTITGTLSREGDVLPTQAAYALVSFADGECYAGRAIFSNGQSLAQYVIYVPQSQQGKTFRLSAGKAQDGMSNRVNEAGLIDGGSYTLSGNLQTAELAFPAEVVTISGTLSLPAGKVAPKDGLVILLRVSEDYMQTLYAVYYLPEGESSLQYSLCAPVSDSTVVSAEISGKVEEIARQTGGVFSRDQLMTADLAFQETVTISGTISVPESCLDGVALVNLYANGMLNGSSVYVYLNTAIPAGKLSVPYVLSLPKGTELNQVQFFVQADTQGILDTSDYYLQEDLKTFGSQYAYLSAAIQQDLEVNIPLSQGVFLSGTLSLADGLSAGTYSGSIRVEPVNAVNGENTYYDYFTFTGDSYDYRISLPEDAAGQNYYISVYLSEGDGVLCYKDYYYVSDGVTTTDRSSATPITMDMSGAVLNLTIPKAKTISGSLVANDGGSVTWDPETDLWLYLESDTYSDSFRTKLDAQGNWSAAVDDELTGSFKLRFYVSGNKTTNVISRTYYYKEGGLSASKDEATSVTIGSGDLSGLQFYVETGWRLSGAIGLPEGGYISGGTVSVSISVRTADNSYTGYSGSGTVGASGGSYSVLVPKQNAEYIIQLNSLYSLPSGMNSNLYWGDDLTLGPVSVTGDADDLDFTLVKAGALITGTVYRPEDVTDYLYMYLYAAIKHDSYTKSYHAAISLNTNEDSAGFSIAIPAEEAAGEYQLYYNISSGNGVLRNRNVYLCQDGSLTTDSSLAGTFSLSNSVNHAFTPLTVQPFATGRVYCPEELTESATITVDYVPASGISTLNYSDTAVDVTVGPGIGQQDKDGRWYSTYTLSGLGEGNSYKLNYYSYLDSEIIDTNWHYLKKDGSVVGYAEADVFTAPYNGAINVVNFTPILWDEGSEDYVLQSAHGISGTAGPITYTYTYPGAGSLQVTFSDRTDISLTVNGRSYDAYSLAGNTVEISGDQLTVVMPELTGSSSRRFGFAVEKVEPVGTAAVETGAAAVYTASGSAKGVVLADVKAGEPLYVSLVGGTDGQANSLLGAVYDENGVMLGVAVVDVSFAGGSCTARLRFNEQFDQAVTLKLFLLDGDGVPGMESIAITEQ